MPTILVVDDDEIHRELTSRCLGEIPDLRILFATEGGEALKQIAEQPPDLVLTDLLMPGMDGLQLVERVQRTHPSIPTILMTSFGGEQTVLQALAAGAASYVSKKDIRHHLVRTVEQVLDVARARRQRDRIFQYLGSSETRFELENDPELIPPLIGFFQDNLLRLGFGDDGVRTQMGMALMEALSNAMLHGNLELSSDLRNDGPDEYLAWAERRRREPPYASRRIHIAASERRDQVLYIVRDEGPGFDPHTLPDPTAPENMVRVCGRGILLIRSFMDQVEYNERGNEVTMLKHNPSIESSPAAE